MIPIGMGSMTRVKNTREQNEGKTARENVQKDSWTKRAIRYWWSVDCQSRAADVADEATYGGCGAKSVVDMDTPSTIHEREESNYLG